MVNPEIKVTEAGDLKKVAQALRDLANARIYVGIPEAETSRRGEQITNAALMYIHTNGANLPNGAVIPPRPVIEPAINAPDNKKIITDLMGEAANNLFDGNKTEALNSLRRAGTAGANASKRWFRDPRNNWPPNAPRTIAEKGSDRPLINKGELRRSITHVEEID